MMFNYSQVIKLYPVLDTIALQKRNCSLLTAGTALLGAGAQLLQIRHKDHWSREVFAEAEAVANLCQKHGAALIVNDRADFALLLDAGLHVGQDDLSPADARRVIGEARTLGLSTHGAEQLQTAAAAPVSYVALGPIFSTTNKEQPDPEVGLERLAEWRSLVPQPLVAIGGITRSNARQVLEAGADSLAVIGDLLPDPCTESTLKERFDEWQRLLNL
jgi:thiamine-phosphate pyrophosphorylase